MSSEFNIWKSCHNSLAQGKPGAEGAAVVVNYAASKADADKVVAEITSSGGKAIAVQADIAKKTDIDRMFAETKAAFGQLDILVNNAGIYDLAPLEAITEEHLHKQFDLNVLGLFLTTQEALKTSVQRAAASLIPVPLSAL